MEQNCGSCKSDRSKKINGQKCEVVRCRRQEASGQQPPGDRRVLISPGELLAWLDFVVLMTEESMSTAAVFPMEGSVPLWPRDKVLGSHRLKLTLCSGI